MNYNLDIFDPEKAEHTMKVANTFANSTMVPAHLRGKPNDIILIATMGAEIGMSPIQSLNEIQVIQGRTSLSAKAMLGIVYARFPDAYVKIETGKESMTCTMARSLEHFDKGLGYTCIWDYARSVKMNLATRDQYKKQPMTMYKWRVVSDCIRTVFPDLLSFFYTPDEVQDVVEQEQEIVKEEVKVAEIVEEAKKINKKSPLINAIKEIASQITSGMSRDKKFDWMAKEMHVDSFGRLNDQTVQYLNDLLSHLERIKTDPVVVSSEITAEDIPFE